MIQITHQAIDTTAALEAVRSPRAGAVVLFLGTVREQTNGRATASLDYECYEEMARDQLAKLEEQARNRWPIVEVALIHRVGHLELGEVSVAVAVSSPHRGDAFAAAQWLIDTLKEVVPIWKQENWADGSSQWVHPGMQSPAAQSAARSDAHVTDRPAADAAAASRGADLPTSARESQDR